MSEPRAAGEAQQDQQNAPDQSGGVSRASEPDLRTVERAAGPRAVESKREDARIEFRSLYPSVKQ